MATRYEPENLMLLCSDCHQNDSTMSAHRTPAAFTDRLWLRYPGISMWVDAHRNDTVTASVPWYHEQIERLTATLAGLERT